MTKRKQIALSALALSATLLTGCDQINQIATDIATEEAGKAVEEWLSPSAPEESPAELFNTNEIGSQIEALTVKGKAPMTNYKREEFGQTWEDVDRNGCDQRNDVLARDLTNVIFKQGTRDCVVLSGTFKDPYTGETIEHVRGGGKVDIDHVVALGQAWASGAQQLTEQERTWLANDPMNLMASDASANRQKGDKEASAWLPPNKSFRCEYVSRQIMVKSKYKLSVTKAEKNAMIVVLNSCPN
ncbi:HNH endonuclease family protein [Glutamicibacter sp. 363]|uniref:HNH endonuclease family protein n=1 Tax=Glutamicibacter sp. 363 TaxID=3457731 RepID=UPI0040348103